MKKIFSASAINKTISSIDKYFTWDRATRTGNSYEAFLHEDEGLKCVYFEPLDYGKERHFFFYYSNNGRRYSKLIKTYADLNELNRLIKVMF